MRLTYAVTIIMLITSPSWSASDRYCTQWSRSASANATTIRQVDQKWAWCLNQDLDPVPEAPPVAAKVAPRATGEASPSCRHYRSFNSRTGMFLDYSGHRRSCR